MFTPRRRHFTCSVSLRLCVSLSLQPVVLSEDVRFAATSSDQPAPPPCDHGWPAARDEPRRARGHRRGYGDAHRHLHVGGSRPLQLGVLRLPVDVYRDRPDLGAALGPVRQTPDLSARDCPLPGRLGPGGCGEHHGAADRGPRDSRPRRWRDHPVEHDHRRRAVCALRACAHAGALQRCLGLRVDCRASCRRIHHRCAVMALGVLPEPSFRAPGGRGDCARLSTIRSHPPGSRGLVGCRTPFQRHQHAAHRARRRGWFSW